MAAVTTKKPGSDLELQLSFPTQFEEAYAEYDLPLGYAPSRDLRHAIDYAGDDLQARIHELRRAEAHQSVRNGVMNSRNARIRAFTSHAGYFGMPKPVLGQRIYANPSLGSGQSDIYPARRDQSDAPFHCVEGGLVGGVLRSKQGQEYGKSLLQARINQLNAIESAKAGLETGEPMRDIAATMAEQGVESEQAVGAKIKLKNLVNLLISALSGSIKDVSRFAASDAGELVLQTIRLVPTLDREEMEDLMESMDEIKELIRAQLDEVEQWYEQPSDSMFDETATESSSSPSRGLNTIQSATASNAYVYALADLIPRLRKYVTIMMGGLNMSYKDRLALSKNAVKSVGLSTLRGITNKRLNEGFEEGLSMEGTAQFTRTAPTREDDMWEESSRGSRVSFDPSVRSRFGDRSGAWFGEDFSSESSSSGPSAPSGRSARTPLSFGFTTIPESTESVGAPDMAFAPRNPFRRMNQRDELSRAMMREAPTPSVASSDSFGSVNRLVREIERRVRAPASTVASDLSAAARPESVYSRRPRANAVATESTSTASGRGKRGKGPVASKIRRAAEVVREHVTPADIAVIVTKLLPLLNDEQTAEIMGLQDELDRQRGNTPAADRLSDYLVARATELWNEYRGSGKKKGTPKKWIQEAVKKMKKGAFTAQALRHDETPLEYAKEVLAKPEKHTVKTRKRAQFAINIHKEK